MKRTQRLDNERAHTIMRTAIRQAYAMQDAPAENELSRAALQRGELHRADNSFAASNFFHEALTTFAMGAIRNEALGAEAVFISPEVQVISANAFFDYMDRSGGMGVQSETDDARPLGKDFDTIDEVGTLVTGRVVNRGLASIIDEDRYPDYEAEAQVRVMQIENRLDLNRLRRAYALHIAAAANTAKVWGGAAQCDADVRAEIALGVDASGVSSNRVLYGLNAWNLRATNYESQNNAGSTANAGKTVERVAADLGLSGGMVSKAIYADGGTAISRVIGSKVLLFNGQQSPTRDDASSVKTFWSNVKGGGRKRVSLRQVGDKLWRVVVEIYETQKLTGTLSNSIRTLTPTAS